MCDNEFNKEKLLFGEDINLGKIIDNIDTASDQAKGDVDIYRSIILKQSNNPYHGDERLKLIIGSMLVYAERENLSYNELSRLIEEQLDYFSEIVSSDGYKHYWR